MLTLWLERRVHVASSLNTTVDAQEQSDARQPPSLSDLLNNPTRRRRDRHRSAIETCYIILRGLMDALADMLFYGALSVVGRLNCGWMIIASVEVVARSIKR